jgi:large subunit ribosomal protein L18
VCAYSDRGDQVLAGAVAQELRKLGWTGSTGNLPAAYLTGFLAGKRAAAKGVTAAVLDLGRQHPTKGGRLFAVLKGLLDAGVDIPHDAGVLPDPERVQGAHLGGDAAQRFAATKSKVEAG